MKFRGDQKVRKALMLVGLTFVVSILFLKTAPQETSWSLLPPMVAIFIAFVSGRLSLSLGSSILVGGFISHYGASQNLGVGLTGMVTDTFGYFSSAATDKSNIQIIGFVFFILSMVQMMTAAKGLHALVRSLQKWIVGPKSAQFVTFLLGFFIFIDDYANTMIVGSTMKKVTDKYKISREKLAFLVDATSAPVAGIALVSTWIGYEVGLFSEMADKFQWSIDGYAIFLDAVPFRFYCFLMLFFVFINVITGVDYGPMKDHELSPVDDSGEGQESNEGHILCALLPLGLLITLIFSLLWLDGGGGSADKSLLSLTSWREVLTKSENGVWILFLSSMLSYALTFFLALTISKVKWKVIKDAIIDGLKGAGLPIMILILAWSLKLVCDDLKSGEFIVQVLSDKVQAQWLPLSIFIVAAITAFSTGTSWGTMAILIPTVTPLAVALGGGEYGFYVALCLAAILDGAIMGDHCSPISDTTIMSSISTDCDLLSHVKTQLPYSLTVGFFAIFFGYLPAGLGLPLMISLPISLVLIVALFFALKRVQLRRRRA